MFHSFMLYFIFMLIQYIKIRWIGAVELFSGGGSTNFNVLEQQTFLAGTWNRKSLALEQQTFRRNLEQENSRARTADLSSWNLEQENSCTRTADF